MQTLSAIITMTQTDASIFMLLIIRGGPRTGKTELANAIQQGTEDWVHIESAMLYNNNYMPDVKMQEGAQRWAFKKVCSALLGGYNVVVSDSLPTKNDIEPYMEFCKRHYIPVSIIKMGSVDESLTVEV